MKRLLGCFGLLLAILWTATPAIAAWPKAQEPMGETCGCCHSDAAIVGGLGCGACQVAPVQMGAPTGVRIATVVAWLPGATADVVGLDLAPADPPPRFLSVR